MLLALDKDASEREFRSFVKRVITWNRWIDEYPDDVYMISEADNLLATLNFYPVYPVFEELMKRYKVDYVKACDLNKSISKLLNKSKKIDLSEDGENIDSGLECEKVEVTNDTLPDDNRTKLAFKKLLWYTFCQCKKADNKIEEFVLFSKNLTKELTLKIQYFSFEENGNKLVECEAPVKLHCYSSLKKYFGSEDTSLSILSQTKTKGDIELALRVAIFKNGELKRVAESIDNYDFVIQDSFFDDFCTAHYPANKTVLNSMMESMSYTLLNKQMCKREDYRTGKGGNNGQMHHGGYYAWRRYVTTSIKMQYWQKDKRYKFANIREHDRFACVWEDDEKE